MSWFSQVFDTTLSTSGISVLYSERLMGHDIGLNERYTKISDEELLEGNDRMPGYVDVINYLTINDENRLKEENRMLTIKAEKIERIESELNEIREMMHTKERKGTSSN